MIHWLIAHGGSVSVGSIWKFFRLLARNVLKPDDARAASVVWASDGNEDENDEQSA